MDIEAKGGSAPGKTPHNTVNTSYSDKLAKRINSGQSSAKSWRLSTENSQPALYDIPDRAESVNSVGAGIWTVEGHDPHEKPPPEDGDEEALDDWYDEDEERRKKLFEKEFDDYYEENVHKSAGPVVFVSKMLGMIPVIWTEEQDDSDCKSYYNLYTFIIFAGWIGLAAVSGLRINEDYIVWPDKSSLDTLNATDPRRYVSKSTADTYMTCTWLASLVTLAFGIFKSRVFAEVLFGISECDAQLELQERHYVKIRKKSNYWIAFLVIMLAGHTTAFVWILKDSVGFDILIALSDAMAHTTTYVLDLQYLFMIMVLAKRYRLCNKILLHITKPWKTFRDEQPSNFVVQNILQYKYDQIFDPENDPEDPEMKKKSVPIEKLIKSVGTDEQKVSKDEESTFLVQLDILRGIHADLNELSFEVSQLFGLQMLFHVIGLAIYVIMFGYFFTNGCLHDYFYWPYLVEFCLPAIRIFLIGHWGQHLERVAREPYMTICQISTIDGSAKLERQVTKITAQMKHQCPTVEAAGYFRLGRNMILKTFGVAAAFTFFMVQFEQAKNPGNPWGQPWLETENN